jgi:hypothetical protein
MSKYQFRLVEDSQVLEPIGRPIDDRNEALAVAKRIAIDIAENRQGWIGKGRAVAVVDESGTEIHRENIDSAEKSG